MSKEEYKPNTAHLLSILAEYQNKSGDSPKLRAAKEAVEKAETAARDLYDKLYGSVDKNKQLVRLNVIAKEAERKREEIEYEERASKIKLRNLIRLEGPSPRVLREVRKLVGD